MNKRRQHILFLVLAIISIGFIALTILVMLHPTSFIDIEFSEEIQEHQNKFLDTAMYLISCPGFMPESPIMIVCTSLLLFIFRYKKAAVYILFTMIAGLVSTIAKVLINRPRPTDDLVRVVLKTTQQSFPSGHVLFYVVFFGFVVVLMYQLEGIAKWARVLVASISLFMIFAIPFSRIYLGAHWFTDVAGGFLLGLLCLYLLSWLYLRTPAKRDEAPVAEQQ
ncbi:phosphatase PAP2 family protein [Mucilaginibacter psychrotolerans]|uniref:Phosphatase PAP2 family protein n=1 Tax=Mucilaginibacter psychrotolerans TaxID=1524096 RepID=A0A4Y8SEI2_9SPHI|nr:phosphatase PAP2 family protein [Mucilaginibacter psychrotolerans]TFF36864.1 phosphatase PAP2 family protein [Mucilaginibacter psychrotolerans]